MYKQRANACTRCRRYASACSNVHGRTHRNRYGYGHANRNVDSVTHAHADTHSNADRNAHAYGYAPESPGHRSHAAG